MIGASLAHYRINGRIGAGGMGEVYRAADTKLGREVALKLLPADTAAAQSRLERFRREARALAALNHPHIVTIYSVEEASGLHFLTMELVEGRALSQLLRAGALRVEQLFEIGEAIAEALAAAHEKGIVHRDLKPANVMVASSGRVKVLDFGLAKLSVPPPEDASSRLSTVLETAEGVVMGTTPYMSPEQVEGRPVDHRSDIFSLGVVLYEMAVGRRPFQAGSSAALISAILRDTPRPIGELRSDLPAGLSLVIGRCLEKSADDRWSSARDVRDRLRGIRAEAGEKAPVVPTPQTVSTVDMGTTPPAVEEFRVAVLPFVYTGADGDLAAVADGLPEEIVTGLSRFSYLRVIALSSTQRYSKQPVNVRDVRNEIGARYVLEGGLRQAGRKLRLAVKLVDASTGAHLWAERYDRSFSPEAVFTLQDDLVPRIVSTVADWYGVLPHSMSEAVRFKPPERLTPHEAVLRSFGYLERVAPEEHAAVRAGLERAVAQAPGNADCWAMLSVIYGEEHRFGYNAQPHPLERSLQAAHRAVDAARGNNIAWFALALALFFRKEFHAFREAAERSIALNSMDGAALEWLGHLIAFAGDWERGCSVAERARQLNPNHPGWYWAVFFFDAFRRGDYQGALRYTHDWPRNYFAQAAFAALHGHLGDHEAARRSLARVLNDRPDFAETGRREFEKWYQPDLVDRLMAGLEKAGLFEAGH